MKCKWVDALAIPEKHIPFRWRERLLYEGKLGGVLLVFIEAESRGIAQAKVEKIQAFCEQLKEESL